jgi:hypothetical protein
MSGNRPTVLGEIGWERARAIFGNADPPSHVWEQQFDYMDDDLRRIAATPYRDIDRDDLWYYFHDLSYVELQPELFRYLFPVCLMEWHETLMRNEGCSKGDSDFHRGMRNGSVFEKMLTPAQKHGVVEFFRDCFLQRLDAEPVVVELDSNMTRHPFGWICRFNSLGSVIPNIEELWSPWWRIDTRGRAIAVLKYCSGLIYFEGENKLFGFQAPHYRGYFGPQLWETDSPIYGDRWFAVNVEFLRATLSVEYIFQKIEQATVRLRDTPEYELGRLMMNDAARNHELLESRIAELPNLLAKEPADFDGWSV